MKVSQYFPTLAIACASLLSKRSAALATGSAIEPRTASNGYNNVVYFANWDIYGRNYMPANMTVNQITHVLYSFANIQSDGTVELSDTYADLQKHYAEDSWCDTGNDVYGNVKQLYLLKQQNRNMKVLLSIGGWTYSPTFPAAFGTASTRATFVQTAVQFVRDLGFDGIDIDYEYPPTTQDAENFVSLLSELRTALNTYTSKNGGEKQLITIACPAGPQNYEIMDLKGMSQYVDMWNLMAYDYAGSFSNDTGHQANLYPSKSNPNATPFNTDQAIDYYISQGIPSGNINLGMPVYGRAFTGTKGLGQPYTGVGAGTWQAGVYDYKDLPQAGAVEMYDNEAGASYSWDATNEILISYDTVDMVQNKTAYILSKKLGGSMFWEASSDGNGNKSLIAASWNVLSAAGMMDSTQNTISYPSSQYDNLRGQMAANTTTAC